MLAIYTTTKKKGERKQEITFKIRIVRIKSILSTAMLLSQSQPRYQAIHLRDTEMYMRTFPKR